MHDQLACHAGLGLVWSALEKLFGDVTIGGQISITGYENFAGVNAPLPSSAAELRCESFSCWIPVPETPASDVEGTAPVFLVGGRRMVFPFQRVLHVKGDTLNATDFQGLSQWLHDAVCSWKFSLEGETPRKANPKDLFTVQDYLTKHGVESDRIPGCVARVLQRAVYGDTESFLIRAPGGGSLELPPLPCPLRDMGDTKLAQMAARRLVTTVWRVKRGPPATGRSADQWRIRPTDGDRGLDPVHTPEGDNIRLTGYLAERVGVGSDGKLALPDNLGPLFSVSAAQIPFAGYDDPRRLLMAANMQIQAVPLKDEEAPAVRTRSDLPHPPGVNLRVGYMAWRGLNHEDAWVLSESAAKRLETSFVFRQTVVIRTAELPPEILVKRRDRLQPNALLVQRRAQPLLLQPNLRRLVSFGSVRLAAGGIADIVDLPANISDCGPAWHSTVEDIETRDLLDSKTFSDKHEPAKNLKAYFRQAITFHLRCSLPLQVGDKLANRHGHKGIVGAILADNEMPRWDDKPLDALIDPISVVNRSNWGQIYEGLAGTVCPLSEGQDLPTAKQLMAMAEGHGADDEGCWPVTPPSGSWMTNETNAVCGVQFVMRLPHHARNKASASSAVLEGPTHPRRQRFGEMETWAAWAHDVVPLPHAPFELSDEAKNLRDIAAMAGIAIDMDAHGIRLRWLDLGQDPPPDFKVLPDRRDAKDGSGANTGRCIRREFVCRVREASEPSALMLRLAIGPVPPPPNKETTRPIKTWPKVCWLPVAPLSARPDHRGPDGSMEPHELTKLLCRLAGAVYDRQKPDGKQDDNRDNEGKDRLCRKAGWLLRTAHRYAFGNTHGTGKEALLRRHVLGKRVTCSARAAAAPAGDAGLALDEIIVPEWMARVLLSARGASPEELTELAKGRRVWLKRDPVLHRYGLLSVRVRVGDGDVIRLPASLLRPMGCDYDGDTVAVFGQTPFGTEAPEAAWPPALAKHSVLVDTAVFLPGKQYMYGLHLVGSSPDRLKDLTSELLKAGAPPWPAASAPTEARMKAWVCAAADKEPVDGRWWTIIEKAAIDALADDPAMGFGVMPAEKIAGLALCRCGAAKGKLYDGDDLAISTLIMEGHSLDVYQKGTSRGEDPISSVMVAGRLAVPRSGGTLRRLLYAMGELSPKLVQDAQTLTEQLTQQSLSVKGGKASPDFATFKSAIERLMKGDRDVPSPTPELAQCWEELGAACTPANEAPQWRQFLVNPHLLTERLTDAVNSEIVIPVDDLRAWSWMAK